MSGSTRRAAVALAHEPADRDQLPISYVSDPQGGSQVLCRYGDMVWDLTPLMPHSNATPEMRRLHFDRLPAAWRESAKALIYAYWVHGRPGWKAPGPVTLAGVFRRLQRIVRYLDTLGVQRFADVRPLHIESYVQRIRAPDRTVHALQEYVVLELAWILRDHLQDHLPAHPWPESSAREVAGLTGRGKPVSGTQSIPLEIASALFRHADTVLQEAPMLLQVRDELADLERRATVGYKRMFVLKNRHLRSRGLPPLQVYQRALIDVRIAGYIVLGLLSGMRNQELADIRVGCYYETVVDGVTYGWLRSVSRKTGEGATEWMIPPYAGQVIALLERLSQPLREELQAELEAIERQLADAAESEATRVKLLARRTALRQHQHGLFLGKTAASGNIAILSNFGWNAELKRFARNRGIDWQPTTHELRRTFAVFVAAHGRGNLLYLRDHFKHWSLDMTALYALNETQDVDLYAEILEKMEQEQTVRIATWLDPAVRLAGKAGERIMRQRVHMKSMNMVSRKEMAERAGQGIRLRSTGHSWCMADELSCGGRGLYDAIECADCSHAVIDETQRDTWHGLWLQQLELREVNDIGPAARAKIEESIATVKKILRKLDPGLTDVPGKETHVAS